MSFKKIAIVLIILLSTTINGQVSRFEKSGIQIDAETGCALRYIYFPNMYAYYDRLEKVYLYKEKEEWIKADALPPLYGGYSPYSKLAVAIRDYDDEEPQQFIKSHRTMYPYSAKGRFKYKTFAVNF